MQWDWDSGVEVAGVGDGVAVCRKEEEEDSVEESCVDGDLSLGCFGGVLFVSVSLIPGPG